MSPGRLAGLLALVLAAPPSAQAWLAVLSSAADGNDVAAAATVLPGGDVVVTGSVQNGATHEDLLAARLDARSGRPVWRVEVNGESADGPFALDAGWDVAVDRRGDVVVGGTIETPDGGPDATVLRLDGRSGRERWRTSMRIAGVASFDLVHDVLVHPSGDVIAVMMATDDAATHFFALRLDGASGEERWRQPLPFPSHDRGWVALDPSGNLVVAGRDYDYVADRPIARVLEVTGDGGAVVWSREFPGFGMAALAVGRAGEVFVGGWHRRDGAVAGTVVRLDGVTGVEAWRLALDGGAGAVDRLAVGRDGAVVVAGRLTDDSGRVAFVARHEPITGGLVWRTLVDRGEVGALHGGVLALALGRSGDVTAAIASLGVDSHLLVRLDATTGAAQWRHDTGGIAAISLAITQRGDVVGAGLTPWNDATGIDVAVFGLDGRTGRDLGQAAPARPAFSMCGT